MVNFFLISFNKFIIKLNIRLNHKLYTNSCDVALSCGNRWCTAALAYKEKMMSVIYTLTTTPSTE